MKNLTVLCGLWLWTVFVFDFINSLNIDGDFTITPIIDGLRKEPIVINKKMDPLTIPNDRLGKGIRPLFICVGFEVKFQKGISNGTIEWGTVEDVAEAHYQKDPFDIYIVRFVKKEEVPDFYNQIPKYWPDLVKRAAFVEDKVVRFIGKLSNVSGTNFRKKTNFIGHSVGGYLAERIAHYLRPFAHAFFISVYDPIPIPASIEHTRFLKGIAAYTQKIISKEIWSANEEKDFSETHSTIIVDGQYSTYDKNDHFLINQPTYPAFYYIQSGQLTLKALREKSNALIKTIDRVVKAAEKIVHRNNDESEDEEEFEECILNVYNNNISGLGNFDLDMKQISIGRKDKMKFTTNNISPK